uniref:Uncharacterized protein n=1 Tax=Cyprinus carpio TaxID=7962 RepID=A0A8C2FD30_CYPCA
YSEPGLNKSFLHFIYTLSEKVGGAEGTKLDDDFKEMEKVCSLSLYKITHIHNDKYIIYFNHKP